MQFYNTQKVISWIFREAGEHEIKCKSKIKMNKLYGTKQIVSEGKHKGLK